MALNAQRRRPQTNNLSPAEWKYIRRINDIPKLSAQEEIALALRWRQSGDLVAREQLITAHSRFVVSVVLRHRSIKSSFDDLVSVGHIGLLEAANRYDPDRGFRFSTYAMYWIRASIYNFILQDWSLVKVGTSTAQRRLFFSLRRVRAQVGALNDGPLTSTQITEIARRLNVSEVDVVLMDTRLRPDSSLNMPLADGEDGFTLEDVLADQSPSPEDVVMASDQARAHRDLVGVAVQSLSDREQDIIRQRYLAEKPCTLEDLAQVYGITRERIRQIEAAALNKMRRAVKKSRSEKVILRST